MHFDSSNCNVPKAWSYIEEDYVFHPFRSSPPIALIFHNSERNFNIFRNITWILSDVTKLEKPSLLKATVILIYTQTLSKITLYPTASNSPNNQLYLLPRVINVRRPQLQGSYGELNPCGFD